MVDQFAKVFATVLLVATPTGAAAQNSPFNNVIMQARQGDGAGCREGIVVHRIQEWYDGPPVLPAFATVEELMAEVTSPIDALEAQGCNPEFLWGFLACAREQSSTDGSSADGLVARDSVVFEDRAFETIMMACLDGLDEQGIVAHN